MSDKFNLFGSKVSIILLLVFVIFIYIIMFSILHKNNETPTGWLLVIEIVLWATLIIIIIVIIKWLNDTHFSIDVSFAHFFDDQMDEVNVYISTDEEKEEKEKKCDSDEPGEVFHVEDNIYSYDDAKGVCSLLGSRLATFDEVERAQKNGANWCSYGWSDEQLALFPIQKSVYNELKTIPGHQHDCGRPGINGGYIEDSTTKFGVNCFGTKPTITDKDKAFMKEYTYTPTISQADQTALTNKIKDILISPFNKDKWNF